MDLKEQSSLGSTSEPTPPWRCPGWAGPPVETRPTEATPEWPNGAVERVTFTLEAFPDAAFPECLPYTEYFGADGWPLHTPDSVKPRLDPRMQAPLRKHPWTCRPEDWREHDWIRFASSYEAFQCHEMESVVVRDLASPQGLSRSDST